MPHELIYNLWLVLELRKSNCKFAAEFLFSLLNLINEFSNYYFLINEANFLLPCKCTFTVKKVFWIGLVSKMWCCAPFTKAVSSLFDQWNDVNVFVKNQNKIVIYRSVSFSFFLGLLIMREFFHLKSGTIFPKLFLIDKKCEKSDFTIFNTFIEESCSLLHHNSWSSGY